MRKLIVFLVFSVFCIHSGAQVLSSFSVKKIDYYKSSNQIDSIYKLIHSNDNNNEFLMDSNMYSVEYNVAVGNFFIEQNKYDSSLIYLKRALSFSDLSPSKIISKNESKEAKQYHKLYQKYLNTNDTILLSFIEKWRKMSSKNEWEFNRAIGDFYLDKNLDSTSRYYFKAIVSCPSFLKMKWKTDMLWNLVDMYQESENYGGVYVLSSLIPQQNWLTPKLYEANALLELGLNLESIEKLNEIDSLIKDGAKLMEWDLYNLAYLFHENQLLSKALFYYNKCTDEGKLGAHDLKEVEYQISNVFYESGNYDKSLEVLLSIYEFYQKPKKAIHSEVDLIELKYEIASGYSTIGNFNLSQFYLDEYKRTVDSVKFPKDYWRAINLLGNNYMDLGKYKNAIQTYEYAIEFYKKNVITDAKLMTLDLTINYSGIANAYQEMGNFDAANKIAELNRRIIADNFPKNTAEYIESLVALSTSYFYSGDTDSSLYYLKEVDSLLPITSSLKPLVLATIENNRIISFLEMKDYGAAIKSMDKSIEYLFEAQGNTTSPNVVSRILNKADIFKEMGEIDSAIYYCRKGLELSKGFYEDQHPELNFRNSLLAGYLTYNEEFEEAYALYSNVYNNFILEISQSFTWLSYMERELFWEDRNNFFYDLNDFVYLANDQIEGSAKLSYNANLISKSLMLETSRELDEAISQSSNEEMKTQFSEMKQLRRLHSKMQSEGSTNKELMEQYKTQADSLDKILVNSLGEYAASKRKFEVTWNDIQSNLSTSDAAIEFAKYFDDKDSVNKYMALVVRPEFEYPKIALLGEEEEISNLIQSKSFSSLYRLVWYPIEEHLKGVERIYYSPAGQLNNVSFSALCFGKESDTTLVARNEHDKNRGVTIEWVSSQACDSYLMDKYELHQLTTTRYLADGTLEKERKMNTSIALSGGINYDSIPVSISIDKKEDNDEYLLAQNLSKRNEDRSSSNSNMEYLQGTKKEVNQIGQLVASKRWVVSIFSESGAEEGKVKGALETGQPGIIHIATHGFAFPDIEQNKKQAFLGMEETSYRASEDPMVRCGLMLSGSNISWTGNPQKMIQQTGEDGILTAAEVSNLDLSNTKLVVLSACETGLGKIEGSEGTFGLKRGFKLAGVEQIIVSLWSVPDKETMELMTLFYTDLAQTLNPVISFEKAQKEMRNRYPTEPEKWAGFVLVR